MLVNLLYYSAAKWVIVEQKQIYKPARTFNPNVDKVVPESVAKCVGTAIDSQKSARFPAVMPIIRGVKTFSALPTEQSVRPRSVKSSSEL